VAHLTHVIKADGNVDGNLKLQKVRVLGCGPDQTGNAVLTVYDVERSDGADIKSDGIRG